MNRSLISSIHTGVILSYILCQNLLPIFPKFLVKTPFLTQYSRNLRVKIIIHKSIFFLFQHQFNNPLLMVDPPLSRVRLPWFYLPCQYFTLYVLHCKHVYQWTKNWRKYPFKDYFKSNKQHICGIYEVCGICRICASVESVYS